MRHDVFSEEWLEGVNKKRVGGGVKVTHEKGTVVGMETSAPERPVGCKKPVKALGHAAGSNPAPPPHKREHESRLSWELVIVGQIKSGKNRILITRTGHRYPPEAFKVWRDRVVTDLVKQWQQPPITVPVRLYCTYWPGDRRTRDVSGMMDAMFHVLVKAGVLKDDGLVWDCTWLRQHMNAKGPKVLITISEWGI